MSNKRPYDLLGRPVKKHLYDRRIPRTRRYDQLGRPLKENMYDSPKPPLLTDWCMQQKAAVLKAAPFVVGVTTFNVSAEMTRYSYCKTGTQIFSKLSKNRVFMGSGTIIECIDGGDGDFFCIILTTASLFFRSNGVQPSDIKVKVDHADGKLYEAKLLDIDFHYNLAALVIQSATPLQVAKLKELDDILPIIIDDIEPHPLEGRQSFQLRPHSRLFKVCKGALVGALRRRLGDIFATFSQLSLDYPKLDCKELYSLNNDNVRDRGGPAINCHGEVIGIMVGGGYFLSCNVVSRWWKFYKKHRKFCRPYLGVKVANLDAAAEKFLEPFLQEFPTFLSGVIVTEVAQNSVAYGSGLRSEDVIVQCDAALIRSTLEFFARVWDKVGESVELTVLRLSSGECMNLRMTVDEATDANFYRWPVPEWRRKPVSKSKLFRFKGLSKFEELFERPDDPGKMTKGSKSV